MPIGLVIAVLFSFLVHEKNPAYLDPIRRVIPVEYRDYLRQLRDTLRDTLTIHSRYAKLQDELAVLKNTDLSLENKKLKAANNKLASNNYNELTLPETQFVNLRFDSILLEKTENEVVMDKIRSGYLAIANERVVLVSRRGRTFLIDPSQVAVNKVLDLKEIGNNLKDHSFFDSPLEKRYPSIVLITDVFVYEEQIYLSLSREVSRDCFNSAIFVAKTAFDYLRFSEWFSYNDCVKDGVSINAGGRIAIAPEKNLLFFSVGTFAGAIRVNNPDKSGSFRAQNSESVFGKILAIDLKTKEYEVFSSGHRNPQGLFWTGEHLLATEHGPFGGDEVNVIYKDKNYGWPEVSYGEVYGYLSERGEQIYGKSHARHGFAEPVYAFVPSIGISQIIRIPEAFSKAWPGESFFIGSLFGKKLFRVIFDENINRVITIEEIYVGKRIRDIVYDFSSNQFLMIMENMVGPGQVGSLGLLKADH